jgi:hypothetical protein
VPLILPLANTRREKKLTSSTTEKLRKPAATGEGKEHTKDLNATSPAHLREAATEATEDQKQRRMPS